MDLNEATFTEFRTDLGGDGQLRIQKLLPPAHGNVDAEILGCHFIYLMDLRTGDVIKKPVGACTPDAHLGATED